MIDKILLIEFFVVIVLVALSAFFSSAETAFISANRIKMLHLAESGNKRAGIIHSERQHPEKFVTTILVGNNIVNVAASVIATAISLRYFGNSGIAIATGAMTITILVFGEIVPKTFAAKHADTYALRIASTLLLLTRIMYPLVTVFGAITNTVFRITGVRQKVKNPFITEDQIKLLMQVGVEEGVFERHERDYIRNIFEFTDEYAANIMTPRSDLVCIRSDSTLIEALEKINESGHSRLPVLKGSPDNVVGMIYAKDLLRFRDSDLAATTVEEILRPIPIVDSRRKIATIFRELQTNKMQIAVVMGNGETDGKIVGILSIEDILEEIVGEIHDEYDVEEMQNNTCAAAISAPDSTPAQPPQPRRRPKFSTLRRTPR